MSIDLDRLLPDAAATPRRPVDVEALHARAERARRRGRVAMVACAVGLVAVAGTAALALLGDQRIILGPADEPEEPAEQQPAEHEAAEHEAAESGAPDPVALVGLWEVLDAGEEPGAILRLDVGDVRLFRRCGAISGAWATDGQGGFLADPSGWSNNCGLDPWPEWLHLAAAHRPDDDGHVLVDETGEVLARLVPGEEPTLPSTVAQSEASPPQVTEDTRARLAPAAPLPVGFEPADAGMLLGRWIPTDAPLASPAQLRMHDDGSWTAFDGCNGVTGRWRSGPDGGLVTASALISTAIGCENVPVDLRTRDAARAGFDGDVLVLFDRDAGPLGRFERSDCEPGPEASAAPLSERFPTAEDAVRAVPDMPADGTAEERARDASRAEFAWMTGAGISHRIFVSSDEHSWRVRYVESCAQR